MNKEKWKDIKGYEGLYKVSNLGNIKSLNKNVKIKSKNQYNNFEYQMIYKEKILKPILKSNGYLSICLIKGKSKKVYYIHKLVAQTFIHNPSNYKYINHKDENKTNNNVNNLEWCSAKYNCNYGNRNKKIINKLNIKILQYDLDGNFIKQWDSMKEATKKLNIRNISQVVNGKRNKAGGYIWKKSNA